MNTHFVVAMMTSQIAKPHFPHDVVLGRSSEAGLPKTTLARLSKVVTLDSSLVLKKLGSLHKSDVQLVKKEFVRLFEKVL